MECEECKIEAGKTKQKKCWEKIKKSNHIVIWLVNIYNNNKTS